MEHKEHYMVIQTTFVEDMTETLNELYEEGYVLLGQVMPVSNQYATLYVATLCWKDC